MTESTEHPGLLPYIKPFVRSLDVLGTGGGKGAFLEEEFSGATYTHGNHVSYGPS